MRPIKNEHFIDKLMEYLKIWGAERLVQDRTGKILNTEAYSEFITWCESKNTVVIPTYALFNRHCERGLPWIKYHSKGKTHFHGYRFATEQELLERLANSIETAQAAQTTSKPRDSIPDWQKENQARANRERMETVARVHAMRAAKEAENNTENN